LKQKFLQIGEKVNVVLACRVSPKQKADVVQTMRDRFPTKTTLSIGDGANDVNMITTAHVGVGISGLEGQQAARSADFVIGQFKFLKTLLFVHGRESYRKNAYLVCYNFYKNALYVLPQYWFGFYSTFSGQTLYEPLIYQMYNIMFTSVPIVWFAVMDTQFVKNDLLTNTKHYRIGLKDQCFGTAVFWRWFTLGAIKALILMYVCLYAMDISMRPDGHMLGLWPEGAIVYAGVVLIANHKLFLEFNYISYHGPVLLIISASLYFGFLAFESVPAINFDSTLGIFGPIFSSPLTYFALFFVVVVNYVLDRIIFYILTIVEERELEREKIVEIQIESTY